MHNNLGHFSFEILELELGHEVSLVNRMLLSLIEESENISFMVEIGFKDLNQKQVGSAIQNLSFFKSNRYNLYFVQNGELLAFDSVDTKSDFLAYEKVSNQNRGVNLYVFAPSIIN